MSARLASALLALLLTPSLALAADGKRYALLVGVRDYDHADFPELKYTENDAEELAKVLTEAGYDVTVLSTTRGKTNDALKPTAKNVRDRLKKLSAKVTKDDLLLVGLAGHGVLWPVYDARTKTERDESFFCPSDARPRSKEPLDELEKTMIPLGELFRRLDESGAGVRLLLVDACRNEARGQKRNVDVDGLPRAKKGTAVLFSCKSGETAHETKKLGAGHGVFFYHVIQALKGEAKNKRDEVTWTAMAEHVTDRVTEDVPKLIGDGAKQTPHEMKNVEGRSPLLLGRRGDAALAASWFDTAEKHYYGRDVKRDYAEAAKWYRKAADKGHAEAAFGLGWMRHRGQGVEQDDAEAAKWYKKAADKGHAEAQCGLGFAYAQGIGVKQDYDEGIKWYRKAIDQGSADAHFNLGLMYKKGQGVEQDYDEALKLFRKAAAKDHAAATCALGVMYDEGQGVKQDQAEAAKWYRKAADKGDAVAAYNLGQLYEAGQGVEKSRAEALKWYKKAADGGDEDAKKRIAELEKEK